MQQQGFIVQQGVYQPPTTIVLQQPTVRQGGCPLCGGTYREQFTVCGILIALLFFPLGVICCLLMTEKRCSNCGR